MKNICNNIYNKIKERKGFVILLAVTLTSILLTLALGIGSVVFKEISLGTSAKDSNDAFFAADTGIECAFFYDKSTSTSFPIGGGVPPSITCASNLIPVTVSNISGTSLYSFTVPNLGSGQACALVTVYKAPTNTIPSYISTKVVSKGYNTGSSSGCASTASNLIEREIDANY